MERQAGSQGSRPQIGDQKWTNEIKAALDERDLTIATQLGKVEQENADLRRCLEEVEAKASRPGLTTDAPETKEQREHCKLFLN